MDAFAFVVLALAPTALAMMALRGLAQRFSFTDSPKERHKRHQGPVPLIGGVAMFIGITVAAALVSGSIPGLKYFLLPALLLVFVGAIDDRIGVRIGFRFAAQITAVVIMIIGGILLRDIGDPFGTGLLSLGRLAIVLSIVIAVTVINAFNFADGSDGLAASLALIALTFGLLASGPAGPTTILALIACGAIAGFLAFNLPGISSPQIRAFMGDAGSTLLGFTVVWFTISIAQGEARALSPVDALWFALVPLADLFSCFVRRILKGKLPLMPGREHFHYMLMRAGFSAAQTLAVLAGLALVYACTGLAAARLGWPDWLMFTAWIALLAAQYKIIRGIALHYRLWRWKKAKASHVEPAGGNPSVTLLIDPYGTNQPFRDRRQSFRNSHLSLSGIDPYRHAGRRWDDRQQHSTGHHN